ncbi:hypothetical protein LCGC14_0342290 [marine sediment metagenome]|uniref:Uncharacterized protein n=1 Tax=marine sediment metagenome TaxID=412755 RepID=A0A0F9TW81_9ZZZZ
MKNGTLEGSIKLYYHKTDGDAELTIRQTGTYT